MNRDELLFVCFGREDLPRWRRIFEDYGPDGRDCLSIVCLDYRRVIIYPPTVQWGAQIAEAATTVPVAAIMNVCTDPDHRGEGRATANLERAHAEAASKQTIEFAALFAGPELQPFYERFGYYAPPDAPENFMVCPIPQPVEDGEAVEYAVWPEGRIDTRGTW